MSCGAVNADAANVCSGCGKQLKGSWGTPNTGYKNEYTGTYSTDGNQLTMKYDNGEVITYSFELVEDSLILTYSNDDSEYQKIYVKQ